MKEALSAVFSALDNTNLRTGLERSVKNFTPASARCLGTWPYLTGV